MEEADFSDIRNGYSDSSGGIGVGISIGGVVAYFRKGRLKMPAKSEKHQGGNGDSVASPARS